MSFNYHPVSQKVEQNKTYWMKVEPVLWMVEPEGSENAGMWVAKQGMFSGVPFDDMPRYKGDFKNTQMYQHVQQFVRDMLQHQQEQAVQSEVAAVAQHTQVDNQAHAAEPAAATSDHMVHEVANPCVGAVSDVVVGLPANIRAVRLIPFR